MSHRALIRCAEPAILPFGRGKIETVINANAEHRGTLVDSRDESWTGGIVHRFQTLRTLLGKDAVPAIRSGDSGFEFTGEIVRRKKLHQVLRESPLNDFTRSLRGSVVRVNRGENWGRNSFLIRREELL